MKWWVARGEGRVEIAVRRLGGRFDVALDGRHHVVELVPAGPDLFSLLTEDGRSYAVASHRLAANRFRVSLGDREFEVHLRDPLEREVASATATVAGVEEVRAPIPGKVVQVAVAVGDTVAPDQPLVVLEAMKMENQICAERAGRVAALHAEAGATVEGGQVLVVLE